MKTKVSLAIISLILAVGTQAGATSNGFSFPARNQVAAALQNCGENHGPLVVEEGEVTAVGTDRISFRGTKTGEKAYSCLETEVFVNGRTGKLAALHPIAPGFSFAARLYFDQQGVLRLVDGWYVGAEVEILAVEAEGRLLTVRPLEQTQTYRLTFSPELSTASPVLAPGQVCFLLLDWEHRVRKVLRPEF